MIRSAASKVMWVGRATVFLVGLAVILALVFGVATTAMGANGNPFLLGKSNAATLLTKLTGNVNGSAMQVVNSNAGADDTALSLNVQSGEAPMKVNSSTRVANLNAASAGKADSAASAGFAANAQNAASAQNANTLDNKDSSAFLGNTEKAADADKLDGKDGDDYVSRGVASTHALTAHSYFMVTSSVQEYPFGDIKIRTNGVLGQFQVCWNRDQSPERSVYLVAYVNGTRTTDKILDGCSYVLDVGRGGPDIGEGGDFQIYSRRTQIFGVHSGDGLTDNNYSLMGFGQL